ncbi:MAG: hypothetical protein KGK34_07770 [Chloroflexota bacterium]|nr:hypothetical protein [Chloroflexota bacterium]
MRRALADAVVRTVLYADVFDYPLETSEIQRYLIGESASLAQVEDVLARDLPAALEVSGRHVHLRGRGAIVEIRARRTAASARLWARARRYARLAARLPLVRGVAISGALAMRNAEADGDVDLFVLAQPGRVWTCRLLLVVLVRLAEARGVCLCPNFILSADRLALARRDLFTAHEIVQMVPVELTPALDDFLHANEWTRAFLPNASPPIGAARRVDPPVSHVATAALSSRLFAPLERWERERKIRRLEDRHRREGGSVSFTEHECRGHFGAHDVRVPALVAARVAEIETATA